MNNNAPHENIHLHQEWTLGNSPRVLTVSKSRRGDWFQTYTGRQFWPLDPRPEDFDIHDIAHALSQICRFGGHTLRFYSVAQHSNMVGALTHSLVGQMHDATEAYLGDMVRPLKVSMNQYRDVENHMWNVVCESFNFPGMRGPRVSEAVEMPNCHAQQMPLRVKQADNIALVTERRDLMAPCPAKWALELESLMPLTCRIEPHCPRVAEKEFLAQFWKLVEMGT